MDTVHRHCEHEKHLLSFALSSCSKLPTLGTYDSNNVINHKEFYLANETKSSFCLYRILHAAAQTVLDLKPCDHVLMFHIGFQLLKELSTSLCLLVHRTFVGHAPDYLTNLLTLAADVHSCSSLHLSSGAIWLSRIQDKRSATGRSLW